MSRHALRQVVANGNVESTEALLQDGLDPDYDGGVGHPPLIIACERGHARIAELLLEHGANVDARRTSDYHTALAVAVKGRQTDCVRVLLKYNAKCTPTYGKKPLHSAIVRGCADIVSLLLQAGADANERTEDYGNSTPLHLAIWGEQNPIAKQLLDAGAEPDVIVTHMDTPLGYAARRGNEEAVRMLLEAGARRVDLVSGSESQCCLRLLLVYGVNVRRVEMVPTVEMAVAVGSNQFVRHVKVKGTRCGEQLRSIMWRSPSLETISWADGRSITREETPPLVYTVGDRVRVLDTHGVWRIVRVDERVVHVEGKPHSVQRGEITLASSAQLAWHVANEAPEKHAAGRALSASWWSEVMRRRVEAFLC